MIKTLVSVSVGLSLAKMMFLVLLHPNRAYAQSAGIQACLEEAVSKDASRARFPSEPDYASKHVRPYNLNFQHTPAAVMYPNSSTEVAAIVNCASKNHVRVQARGGGHDLTNKALGNSDGNILVDMQNFNYIRVDKGNGIATIGSGNKLKDIVEGLHAKGARYMPHGSSPSVGIGGHSTVGGLGYQSRLEGAAIDVLQEAEIVIANGSILHASSSQDSDLFWAIRGAGASFGIVTEYRFQTKPEPKQVLDFTYVVSSSDIATLADAYKNYHQVISNRDLQRKLSAVAVVQKNALVVSGSYFGSEDEYAAIDLSRYIPNITNRTVSPNLTWNQHMASSFAFVDSIFPKNVYFDARDTALTYSALPSNRTIDNWMQHLQTANAGSDSWFALMDLYGGAVNDVAADATAFPHRDLAYFFSVYVSSDKATTQTTKTFVDNAVITLQDRQPEKFLSYAGYSNLRIKEPQKKYWGANLERLEAIKTTVDPENIFTTEQGIHAT